MTAGLVIAAVPSKGKPFVAIATDSRATDNDGNIVDENAIKVWKVRNAIFATSGASWDDYRVKLAKDLERKFKLSVNGKIQFLYRENTKNMDDLSLNMTSCIAQLEGETPIITACYVGHEKDNEIFGPYSSDTETPGVNNIYFGDDKDKIKFELNFLDKKLNNGIINKESVEEHATWFIKEVAKRIPNTVNDKVQIIILESEKPKKPKKPKKSKKHSK